MNDDLEVVKVYEYQVHPGAPVELEVARAGRPHTAPADDHGFLDAIWLGPIAAPADAGT